MTTPKNTTNDLLDQAVSATRSTAADAATEQQAADRVWSALRKEAAQAGREQTPQLASVRSIRDKMPESADAERWLSSDRERIRELRGSEPVAQAPKAPRTFGRFGRLALAATTLIAVGLLGFFGFNTFFGSSDVLAEVASVDGRLFLIDGTEARPLDPGTEVLEGQELRTGKAGSAVVRLLDGSLIEIRERSAIALSERSDENTIQVSRGSVIVEAAKQREKELYVATDDCLVAVTGTIFSVNHGIKGSRVSVIEGEVRVEQGRSKTVLKPGEQVATRASLGNVPVEHEIAWSRASDRYAGLLEELRALQVEIDRALSSSDLRYGSELLDLVNPDTVVYIGLPNLTDELGQVERLVEDRLNTNPQLRAWWDEHVGTSGAEEELDQMLERLMGLGEHLGDEVVVSLAAIGDDIENPLLLAEIEQPAAFAAVLADEVDRINAQSATPVLRIIEDPATAGDGDDQVLLWQAGDVFAASNQAATLRSLSAHLGQPSSNPFVASPFHDRLEEAYGQGAQFLLGVDLASVMDQTIDPSDGNDQAAFAFSGLDSVSHLILERKTQDDLVHTGAVLSFDGQRSGAASWLADPAPIAGLDYVSADADFALGVAVEEPAAILEQLFDFIRTVETGSDPLSRDELAPAVGVMEDLAAALGGEMTIALDGPVLPTPSWKIVAEVYNQALLQSALEEVVQRFNDEAARHGVDPLSLSEETVGGRTYYTLPLGPLPLEVHYTFHDGYWVLSASRALVDRAIQIRDSGYALPNSPRFAELLPQDGFVNFSAVMFSDLGELSGQLVGLLASSGQLSPEDQRALESAANQASAPILACAYGESDRIRLVSTSQHGLFSSQLSTLLGMASMEEARQVNGPTA